MPGESLVLDAVQHVCDIAKVNRRAILSPSDDQVLVTFRVRDLAVRSQDERCVFSVELTRPGVRGAGTNRGRQLVERDIARGQGRRVDLDPDRAFDTEDLDLRNAGQNVDPL